MCVCPFALSVFAFVRRVTQSSYLVGLSINVNHASRLSEINGEEATPREEAISSANIARLRWVA